MGSTNFFLWGTRDCRSFIPFIAALMLLAMVLGCWLLRCGWLVGWSLLGRFPSPGRPPSQQACVVGSIPWR